MRKPNLRVTVERPMAGTDWNEEPPNWQYVTSLWISLKPLTGQEREQAEQMQSLTSHTAVSDWFQGASSSMRLRDGDRIFDVKSVVNVDERNRKLEWRLAELDRMANY